MIRLVPIHKHKYRVVRPAYRTKYMAHVDWVYFQCEVCGGYLYENRTVLQLLLTGRVGYLDATQFIKIL